MLIEQLLARLPFGAQWLPFVILYLGFGIILAKLHAFVFWDNFQHTTLAGTSRRAMSFHPNGTLWRGWGMGSRFLALILFPMASAEAIRRLEALDAWWRLQHLFTTWMPADIFLVNTWESSWFRSFENSGRLCYVLTVAVFWPITLVWSAVFVPVALLFHGLPLLVRLRPPSWSQMREWCA